MLASDTDALLHNLPRQLPIRLVLRRELHRTDEDLLRQFDPLRIGGPGLSGAVVDEQARAEEAVFGEAEGDVVLQMASVAPVEQQERRTCALVESV